MSTANLSTEQHQPMSFDDYHWALRSVFGIGQVIDAHKERVMRAVNWGDISPCYMAWDQLREALVSAERAAQERWRQSRQIRVESGEGECRIYRVSTWCAPPLQTGVANNEAPAGSSSSLGFSAEALYEEHLPGEEWTVTKGFGSPDDLRRCRGYDFVASAVAREIIDTEAPGEGARRILEVLDRVARKVIRWHEESAERSSATRLLRALHLCRKGLVPPVSGGDRLSLIEQELREELAVGMRRSALEALAGTVALFALDLGEYPDDPPGGDILGRHVRAFARVLCKLSGLPEVRSLVAALDDSAAR